MTTASMNPQERRICNFVKNNPGRTVLEIADAIDENPSTTKKRTPRLVEHGYLRKVGRRRPYGYRWTGKPFPEVILSWRDREQIRVAEQRSVGERSIQLATFVIGEMVRRARGIA